MGFGQRVSSVTHINFTYTHDPPSRHLFPLRRTFYGLQFLLAPFIYLIYVTGIRAPIFGLTPVYARTSQARPGRLDP